jgi:hypothetical protein
VTNQQKSITAQIVAAEEFLLEELILLFREWAWQLSSGTLANLNGSQPGEGLRMPVK